MCVCVCVCACVCRCVCVKTNLKISSILMSKRSHL